MPAAGGPDAKASRHPAVALRDGAMNAGGVNPGGTVRRSLG
jgi:hypothetical protein